MTLIYGYVSHEQRKAFLGTDNVSFGNQQIVDKIYILDRRYLLAIQGADQLMIPINAMAYVEINKDRERIDSVDTLAQQLLEHTRLWMNWRYPEFLHNKEAGKITDIQWDLLLEERSSVIVLDSQELQMYELQFGCCFPPDGLFRQPVIKKLPTERWLRFGWAAQFGDGECELHQADFDDPLRRFYLEIGRLQLSQRYPGGPGAYVFIDDKDVTYRSNFNSPAQLLEQWAKQGPFDIHVHVANYGDKSC